MPEDEARSSTPDALDQLAAAWLAAEEAATSEPAREPDAVRLALLYEAALASASLEEVRLAWEAAHLAQAGTVMGSRDWAAARRVSELLRVEYAAAKAGDA
jgi:hypothetical protein